MLPPVSRPVGHVIIMSCPSGFLSTRLTPRRVPPVAWQAIGPTGIRSQIAGPFTVMKRLLEKTFTRENLLSVVLCLMAIALLIMTADSSPTWIYQGF